MSVNRNISPRKRGYAMNIATQIGALEESQFGKLRDAVKELLEEWL